MKVILLSIIVVIIFCLFFPSANLMEANAVGAGLLKNIIKPVVKSAHDIAEPILKHLDNFELEKFIENFSQNIELEKFL